MSLGEPRAELDKSGKGCTVYDVVISQGFMKKIQEKEIFMSFFMTVTTLGSTLPVSKALKIFTLGWLGLRPGWLGLRPGWLAQRGEQTNGRTNRKSPHSTGLRPLSGPLPKTRFELE